MPHKTKIAKKPYRLSFKPLLSLYLLLLIVVGIASGVYLSQQSQEYRSLAQLINCGRGACNECPPGGCVPNKSPIKPGSGGGPGVKPPPGGGGETDCPCGYRADGTCRKACGGGGGGGGVVPTSPPIIPTPTLFNSGADCLSVESDQECIGKKVDETCTKNNTVTVCNNPFGAVGTDGLLLCECGFPPTETPAPTETPTLTPSPTINPANWNWYAPDSTLCNSSIFKTYYADDICTQRIGYQTENLFSGENTFACPTYGELKDLGWIDDPFQQTSSYWVYDIPPGLPEFIIKKDINNNDIKIYSYQLPAGFEATGWVNDQEKTIKLSDICAADPCEARTMEPGTWTVYRLCLDTLPIEQVRCNITITDGFANGYGECFKTLFPVTDVPSHFILSSDLNQSCRPVSTNTSSVEVFREKFQCTFGEPARGHINVKLDVNFKPELKQFDRIVLFARDSSGFEPFYEVKQEFPISEIPANQDITYTFANVFVDRSYNLRVEVLNSAGSPVNYQGVTFETVCRPGEQTNFPACDVNPDADISFKITIPDTLPSQLTAQGINQAFALMIDKWINGQTNALKMSEFIFKIQDAPGLKKATCNPTVKGGCLFNP